MDYRAYIVAESGPFPESRFRDWYAQRAQATGIDANPDDPRHQYDYRSAYSANAEPALAPDGSYHWPSQFKMPDHPNRFIRLNDGGILDSLLDKRVH